MYSQADIKGRNVFIFVQGLGPRVEHYLRVIILKIKKIRRLFIFHHFGNNESRESKNFLKKDEHDRFLSREKQEGNENLVEEESEEYHKSYLNPMMDFHKQYNLRSIIVVVDPPKKASEGQTLASQLIKNIPTKQVQQKTIERDLPKDNISKEKVCRMMK